MIRKYELIDDKHCWLDQLPSDLIFLICGMLDTVCLMHLIYTSKVAYRMLIKNFKERLTNIMPIIFNNYINYSIVYYDPIYGSVNERSKFINHEHREHELKVIIFIFKLNWAYTMKDNAAFSRQDDIYQGRDLESLDSCSLDFIPVYIFHFPRSSHTCYLDIAILTRIFYETLFEHSKSIMPSSMKMPTDMYSIKKTAIFRDLDKKYCCETIDIKVYDDKHTFYVVFKYYTSLCDDLAIDLLTVASCTDESCVLFIKNEMKILNYSAVIENLL